MYSRSDKTIPLPLDGILDLHQFLPREVPALVRDYLRQCQAVGVLQLRIIHGKGKGILRERVHAILRQEPMVKAFGLSQDRSSWGATWVDLYPLGQNRPVLPASHHQSPNASCKAIPLWYRAILWIFRKP